VTGTSSWTSSSEHKNKVYLLRYDLLCSYIKLNVLNASQKKNTG
jgi:hypothetical protein